MLSTKMPPGIIRKVDLGWFGDWEDGIMTPGRGGVRWFGEVRWQNPYQSIDNFIPTG